MDGNGDNNGASNDINENISVMELEGQDDEDEQSNDEEEEAFDITIPASHSYMGPDMRAVSGRRVVEAGWRGRVAVAAHMSAVFPGESVPLLLPRGARHFPLADRIRRDRLFALLCPDESGFRLSGFGVVCEVLEAGDGGVGDGEQLGFKARAVARCRLTDVAPGAVAIHLYASMQLEEVQVLPELSPSAPLRHTRLGSLDPYRRPQQTRQLDVRLQRLEAAMTPWPAFLYDMFDYKRIRQEFCDFFKKLGLDNLPEEPVSLSFWVASNLALSARDQAALLATDCALHRLHLALRLMAAKTILCCSSCRTEIARRDHIFAMSSEGVHSNYTNLGGYMHDVVTVSAAQNTALEGLPSAEYSWFPGYTWTIALCAACAAHVGWRFEALKRNLWPQQFYGLCRTSVQPRAADLTLP